MSNKTNEQIEKAKVDFIKNVSDAIDELYTEEYLKCVDDGEIMNISLVKETTEDGVTIGARVSILKADYGRPERAMDSLKKMMAIIDYITDHEFESEQDLNEFSRKTFEIHQELIVNGVNQKTNSLIDKLFEDLFGPEPEGVVQ